MTHLGQVLNQSVHDNENTVIKYVNTLLRARVLLMVPNFNDAITGLTTPPKYYVGDHVFLNGLSSDAQFAQIEHLVVHELLRQLGTDHAVFFLKSESTDLDFYVPELSFGIVLALEAQSDATLTQAIKTFESTHQSVSCQRRQILTLGLAKTLECPFGQIDVIPL